MKKITEEGWRWKYQVEKKKVKELTRDIRHLTYALSIAQKAHARASDAWARAEDRAAKGNYDNGIP